ncbi:MAG: hypothetical protein HWE26_15505 [Alteromonadaceae bacterium]|nr:hypothetical protein [Alteromonadaceae bacterium]
MHTLVNSPSINLLELPYDERAILLANGPHKMLRHIRQNLGWDRLLI